MSAAMRLDAEGNGRSDNRLGRALALLNEALKLLDQGEASPELGARVQAAIDALEEYLST